MDCRESASECERTEDRQREEMEGGEVENDRKEIEMDKRTGRDGRTIEGR